MCNKVLAFPFQFNQPTQVRSQVTLCRLLNPVSRIYHIILAAAAHNLLIKRLT